MPGRRGVPRGRVQHATAAMRMAIEQLTRIQAALKDWSAVPAPLEASLEAPVTRGRN